MVAKHRGAGSSGYLENENFQFCPSLVISTTNKNFWTELIESLYCLEYLDFNIALGSKFALHTEPYIV